jgi:conjugative relaxase-like TrwC/TraI family protein
MQIRIMLTLRAAKNAGYYERPEFAAADYYVEAGQSPGKWVGRGGEELGLEGTPAPGELEMLLEGCDPGSGEPLGGGRGRRPTNAAFDLTFTAPKGLSVLLAVADEPARAEIRRAQEAGVRAALDYLEHWECFVRRGANGVHVLPGAGFVAALYTHEMARSGDPHLHTHLVIANRVRGPDGRWTAPDMRPVYAAAKTAGTIAEAVTRAELTRRLGLEWEPAVNGTADLVAVPRTVREHFSARHAEIVELAALRGYASHAGVAALQRETRDRKRLIARERARAEWRARAAEHGFGERELQRALPRLRTQELSPPDPHLPEGELERTAAELGGPAGLTRQRSTYTRREVLQALAAAHRQGIALPDLERLADDYVARHAVPVIAGQGHLPARYTSPDLLLAEARLIEAAASPPLLLRSVSEQTLAAVIASRPSLGDDQAAAVRHLCSGQARVRVLEARAGAGKTYALEVVRQAYEAEGIPVIGVAWQGQAAELLARDAGIPSETIARLLERIEHGREAIPAGAVVIVDEAGLVPTRPLERLLDEVARRHGRLVLVGDRGQLPAIEAGGGFAALADRLGAAQLTENRRQRDPLQRALAERLAEGRAGDAIALLAGHGRLSAHADARQARAELVGDWAAAALPEPARGLILAHDRREVSMLNGLARAEMERAGLLGAERLVAHGREWAAGDRLVCRRNDYRPTIDVRNGTRGTVTGVDAQAGALRLRTDDGREVVLPSDYLAHAHHAYALTGHVSQGETVERTFLLATPERGGREWAYVSGSRHRIDLRAYLVHHEPERAAGALARTWERSQGKTLALEPIPPAERAAAIADARDQLAGRLPERVPERLRELAAEQEALRGALRTYPEHVAGRIRALETSAERAERDAEAASGRLRALRERLDGLRPWHRRERADLGRRAAHEEQLIARLAAEARAHRTRAGELAAGPRSPRAWEAAHPGLRARRAEIIPELRALQAFDRKMAIARQIADPREAIVRALGRRPIHPERRLAWDRAVAAIAGYRHGRDLADDAASALGPAPPGGRDRPAWQAAAREVERAAAELDRSFERRLLFEGPERKHRARSQVAVAAQCEVHEGAQAGSAVRRPGFIAIEASNDGSDA